MSRSSRRFSLFALLTVLAVLVTSCGGAATPTSAPTTAPSSGGTGSTAATAPATVAGPGAAGSTPATGAGTATPGAAGVPGTSMTGTPPPGSAGASGGTPAAGGAAAGAAGAAALPASCTNVTLAYWNPFTGPDGPFMGKLVDQFNQANPQIKVTMTSQADYNTKLTTAAASDTLPDVAVINEDQVATQAYSHVIRPIDDIMGTLGYTASDFPAASWAMGEVAGKRYAVPLSIVPMTMYYNQDLMTKAGISAPPKNQADFEKAAQAMTSGNVHGFVITTGFPVQQIFQELLHQYGGSEFNADTTQATWNSDAGVKALQWMKDMQNKYSAPKLPVDADLNAFKAGQAGMIWNGIWQTSNVTGDAVDFKSGATATPQIGSQPATWAGEALLGLPVHKKGEDQCKTAAGAMLIKYLIDNSVPWSQAGNIPAYNKARNSDQLKAMQPQASIAPAVENPTFVPAGVPNISDALVPLGDAVGAIMSGTSTDIKGTLDSSVQRANQILAQNKQKFGSAP